MEKALTGKDMERRSRKKVWIHIYFMTFLKHCGVRTCCLLASHLWGTGWSHCFYVTSEDVFNVLCQVGPYIPGSQWSFSGMSMRHPLRQQLSHSINSSRVPPRPSLVLTQLVFALVTVDCRRQSESLGGADACPWQQNPSQPGKCWWPGLRTHTPDSSEAASTLPSVFTLERNSHRFRVDWKHCSCLVNCSAFL